MPGSHKDCASRVAFVFTVVFLINFPSRLRGEGASADSVIVFDAGQPRRFDIARDELHVKDRSGSDSLQQIQEEPSVGQLRERAKMLAASAGADVNLVLYPAGVRNPSSRRLLSRKVLLILAPDASAATVLAGVPGLARWRSVGYLPGAVVVEVSDPTGALSLADTLRSQPGVRSAEVLLARQHQRKLIPNDPFFMYQWHLRNTGSFGGTPGTDIHVTNVWNNFRDAGIVIGIVDDGLQRTHPDLSPNYNSALSYDFDDGDSDPSPVFSTEGHGTACAGLAAARGNNGVGICGVAYEAQLAGLRLIAEPTTDDTDASAMLTNNTSIQIKNNSWGAADDAADLYGIGPLSDAALAAGTQTGRGGRGTIYVFASGNGLANGDNANYTGYANSIYTIAVGALNDQGLQTAYATPGACVVISAPSGDDFRPSMATTDLTGSSGFNDNTTPSDFSDKSYTAFFAGTSASAPVVSGVVALILQARPTLGWRDVKEILMRTATKNAPADSDWAVNSAGLHFNHKFGAGLVNAEAAVAAAQTWTNLAPATTQVAAVNGVNLPIPDSSVAGASVSFAYTNEALRVEHTRLTVDIVHPRRGNLAITLTSPSGMKSRLTEFHADTNANFYSWPLTSVRHWGEISSGTWTATVADVAVGNTGQLVSAKLELLGTPVNPLTVVGASIQEVNGAADGNGFLDPGETVNQSVVVRNSGNSPMSGLNSALTTATPGCSMLQAVSSYAALAPGGLGTNAAAFTYRVDKSVPCGAVIQFTLISTNNTLRLTNHFSQVVGQPIEATPITESFESADAPKPVPDLTTTLSTNIVNGGANRLIDDVVVSVRLDHTTVGDLQIALVHPDGTELLLADHVGGNNPNMGTGDCGAGETRTVFDDTAASPVNSGTAPFAGSYRPHDTLAQLRGKPLDGLWRLRLSDQYSNDSGTLLCWGLQIRSHDQTFACSVFNLPPVATNASLATLMDTPVNGTLPAGDGDGDPVTFQIVTPPGHGQLTGFNINTGAFAYTPDSNFAGSDAFSFQALDGRTNSATATVTISVNPTRPLFTGFEHLSDGRFALHVLAPSGPAYVIESSTNLINWLPIATNTSPASLFDFVDSDAPDYPERFYRVKQ